jgi:mono/diheme cytochrome c family protein
MRAVISKYVVLAALVALIGIFAACGGGESTSASSASSTTAPIYTATAVVIIPTEEPTAIPAPTATTVPDKAVEVGEPSSEEQIAAGKLIFEKTAGGVGCAMCHGMDAMGDLTQAAPPNIGASVEMIEAALDTKPQMSFITMTRDETKAVSAYLVWLKEQQ